MTSSSTAVPITGAAPVSMTSSPSLSRRVSQNMAPPMHPRSTSGTSSIPSSADNVGVGTGPGNYPSSSSSLMATCANLCDYLLGPLRHPRPLTAADIFAELEREQEATVWERCYPYSMNRSHLTQFTGQPSYT